MLDEPHDLRIALTLKDGSWLGPDGYSCWGLSCPIRQGKQCFSGDDIYLRVAGPNRALLGTMKVVNEYANGLTTGEESKRDGGCDMDLDATVAVANGYFVTLEDFTSNAVGDTSYRPVYVSLAQVERDGWDLDAAFVYRRKVVIASSSEI